MDQSGSTAFRGTAWPSGTFMSLLTRSLRDDLWAAGRPMDFRAGDWIARQGDPPDSVAIPLSGFVKTVRAARTASRNMLVAMEGPGELLGVEAVLSGKQRHVGHTPSTDGAALVVGRDAFHDLMRLPVLRDAVNETILQRTILRDASLSFANHKVHARLLAFLARMEVLHGKPTDQGVVLDLGLNRSDLGAAIGASDPAIGKALLRLKREGVLTVRRKRIVLSENLRAVLDRTCELDADADRRRR